MAMTKLGVLPAHNLYLKFAMGDVMDYDMSDVSDMSSLGETWIMQFCAKPRNQFFCEVSEMFIEEEFNLYGLSQVVPRYKEALELILDLEHESPVALADMPAINESGELLYGLIHARYILTRPGLVAMAQKYKFNDFGTCPRVLCEDFGLLPMGRHDMPGYETVRLYCPCCHDIYMPSSSKFLGVDGAFFGSTFPGMVLEVMPEITSRLANMRKMTFNLKIFGFAISPLLPISSTRMKWLREAPESEDFVPAEDEDHLEDSDWFND